MKMIISFAVFIVLVSVVIASAAVHGEEVSYTSGGSTMKGYLAYDDAAKGKRPGVLVVHEWWGHNEYSRMRARKLAEMGYTSLALDMYGDGKQATHPDDAGKLSGEVMKNMSIASARFAAAMKVLKEHPSTDPDHIAAIGYCFGGSVVLNMARQGMDLDGVASFHGGLTTAMPARPGAVKAKILVCNGAADQFVTAQDISGFKKEMDAAKADYQFIEYAGAKHSFTNPAADENGKKFNLPLAYNAEADKKSWTDLEAFLKKAFAK